MKAHPIADRFRMLEGLDLQNMADDIAKNGQKEAIVLYEGKILDGRNRYAACKMVGVEPRTKEYTGKDPVGFVLSKNVWRRHLTTRERADIGAWASEPTGPNGPPAMSQTKAADALKVSRSSVKRARKRLGLTPQMKKKLAPKRDESDGWTAAQLKEDEELSAAFGRIEKIYGVDDTKGIRNGSVAMNRKDVIELSKLSTETMREIQDLIFANRWKPQEAIKFLSRFKLATTSTVEDLENLCLSTKAKRWEGKLGGFRHICIAEAAAKR